ncbi:MAG: Maf-like protein, septum formation protein [Candidatus Peregrinibacteria bacterium GW2011_GWF2_33_10]|nr:MAG: Maf-like protein, septum formation protein [Candidatus Peregrinibacteria bacterium GW2011_GWF2_33_10]OGJ45617.1 MAG: septum formation protein Maf [Candidatus Peregrinibacteria bacterium RIFOXYA2_FULL_33_21]OGJ46780.1 MAG: septum formation protein Maf [Candidatus Peregrinibacteria bacterium RIFOXYA12_FULL_33_12]OGJ51208.1 MAG: septum formation protein Maf [Candidatus Peregrinibacteria bacterium RIFOXYB2_FULL_33_20]
MFPKLILASKSPRRIELLKEAGFDFEVVPSNYEEIFDEKLLPHELVMKHAEGKAVDVYSSFLRKQESFLQDERIILAIDTIGFCNGKVLEKPKDREHAKEMISMLSGTTHEVYSGLCLINLKLNKKNVQHEKTVITFEKMTEEEIEWYLDQNEWQDKAAAYAVQGKGALFVKKISGDFFNVVGLPICRLYQMIKGEGKR